MEHYNRLYALVLSLASSQGFYSRLLNTLQELDDHEKQLINDEMVANNLTTDLDIILWLES